MEEMEYSLSDIISILLKRLWIIVLCIILGTVTAFCISQFFIEKQYTASVQMYVSPNKEQPVPQASISELNYAQAVVDTYIEILKTVSFLDSVVETTGIGSSGAELRKIVQMNPVLNCNNKLNYSPYLDQSLLLKSID